MKTNKVILFGLLLGVTGSPRASFASAVRAHTRVPLLATAKEFMRTHKTRCAVAFGAGSCLGSYLLLKLARHQSTVAPYRFTTGKKFVADVKRHTQNNVQDHSQDRFIISLAITDPQAFQDQLISALSKQFGVTFLKVPNDSSQVIADRLKELEHEIQTEKLKSVYEGKKTVDDLKAQLAAARKVLRLHDQKHNVRALQTHVNEISLEGNAFNFNENMQTYATIEEMRKRMSEFLASCTKVQKTVTCSVIVSNITFDCDNKLRVWCRVTDGLANFQINLPFCVDETAVKIDLLSIVSKLQENNISLLVSCTNISLELEYGERRYLLKDARTPETGDEHDNGHPSFCSLPVRLSRASLAENIDKLRNKLPLS